MSTQVLAGPHFITTAPHLTICPDCRRPVLAATVDGIDRHIDPAALDQTGELTALLAGRPTYTLRGRLLTRRTAGHIRGNQVGLVLAGHHCATTAAYDRAVLVEAYLIGPTPLDDDCPF